MTEHDLRLVRIAHNQSLFRGVNAKLVELNETFETLTDRSVFACECADLECVGQIDMLLSEYTEIRANPRRFFVLPSEEHVAPEAERVVADGGTYFVVEKIGVAAEAAESLSSQ